MKLKPWLLLVSSSLGLAACGDGGARAEPQTVTERPLPNVEEPVPGAEVPTPNLEQPRFNEQQPVSAALPGVPALQPRARCRAADQCAGCDEPCARCECMNGAGDASCQDACQ